MDASLSHPCHSLPQKNVKIFEKDRCSRPCGLPHGVPSALPAEASPALFPPQRLTPALGAPGSF